MDIALGRFPTQLEAPETIKFAVPIVLLPELFATTRHLAVMLGYLATIGWEVYAPDLSAAGLLAAAGGTGEYAALISEALDALGRDVVLIGHGLGGTLALKMTDHLKVRAAVAIAPMMPRFRTPLLGQWPNRLALKMGRTLKVPSGRTLFDFVADVEPFQRAALIKSFVPQSPGPAREVLRGDFEMPAADRSAPRLVIGGDSDPFAPAPELERFAQSLGAQLKLIAGRGHWLIGGRALERVIGEAHRFLVRSLGQDLLLLFPEEWKDDPERSG